MKPNIEAAREYADSCDNESGSFLSHQLKAIRLKAFNKDQSHILDTLAEMAKDKDKAFLEASGSHEHSWTYEMFRDGAHFGFTLGRASMQVEIKKLRDRPTDGEYKNRYHKQKEWEVLMRDKLTQRDAEIAKLEKEIDRVIEVADGNSKACNEATAEILRLTELVDVAREVEVQSHQTKLDVAVEALKYIRDSRWYTIGRAISYCNEALATINEDKRG